MKLLEKFHWIEMKMDTKTSFPISPLNSLIEVFGIDPVGPVGVSQIV